MNVAIVGSRGWTQPDMIKRYVDRLGLHDVVISGGARGVDTIAANYARVRGLEVVVIPAVCGAGMIRNSEIVARADLVLAFWDGESRGTRDTIHKALAAPNVERITVIKG